MSDEQTDKMAGDDAPTATDNAKPAGDTTGTEPLDCGTPVSVDVEQDTYPAAQINAPVEMAATVSAAPHANNNEDAVKGDRVAKVIAAAGLCSRREAERWIEAGRVAVNGKRLDTPAHVVTDTDRIVVDGKPLPARAPLRVWRYHKPRDRVSTHADPQGRPTVFEALPKDMPRVISVGRLDLATEGLLLLTTSGGLSRHLELPSTAWLRRYRVRARGTVTDTIVAELAKGVTVGDENYGPIEARVDRTQGANTWLTVGLREGKNREVRRVLLHFGLEVNRLIRVSYGPFQLGDLAVGALEEVKPRILIDQLGKELASELGLDAPTRESRRAQATGGATPRSGGGKPERSSGARKSAASTARRRDRDDVDYRRKGEGKDERGNRSASGGKPDTRHGSRPGNRGPQSDRPRGERRDGKPSERRTSENRPHRVRGDDTKRSDKPDRSATEAASAAPWANRRDNSSGQQPDKRHARPHDRRVEPGGERHSDRKPSGDRRGPRDEGAPRHSASRGAKGGPTRRSTSDGAKPSDARTQRAPGGKTSDKRSGRPTGTRGGAKPASRPGHAGKAPAGKRPPPRKRDDS